MSYEIIHGNCLEVLLSGRIPKKSVHVVGTSSPYFGLRDYGIAATVWGGDSQCPHVWTTDDITVRTQMRYGKGAATAVTRGGGHKAAEQPLQNITTGFCALCNAWLGTLGNEPSAELFTKHLGLVLQACHHVLRDDGTVWWNLGDSYWGTGGGQKNTGKSVLPSAAWPKRPKGSPGLKPKDLVGIPWRFAFAAQGFAVLPASDLRYAADLLQEGREKGDWELVLAVEQMLRGWSQLVPFVGNGMYNRADIVWFKPGPQPEPVQDRPTKNHEMIFLLAKSKRYYFDAYAIAEPLADLARYERAVRNREAYDPSRHKGGRGDLRTRCGVDPPPPMALLAKGAANVVAKGTRNRRTVWEELPVHLAHPEEFPETWEQEDLPGQDVWKVATGSYKGPHYAVMPSALIRPCILSGSSERGACPECGAPWRRLTEGLHRKAAALREGDWEAETEAKSMAGMGADGRNGRKRVGLDRKSAEEKAPVYRTLGWKPTCAHYDHQYPRFYPLPKTPKRADVEAVAERYWRRCRRFLPGSPLWETVPCVVLDPFSGMATTALEADRLGRHGIGIEANFRDVLLSRHRIANEAPVFHGASMTAADAAEPPVQGRILLEFAVVSPEAGSPS